MSKIKNWKKHVEFTNENRDKENDGVIIQWTRENGGTITIKYKPEEYPDNPYRMEFWGSYFDGKENRFTDKKKIVKSHAIRIMRNNP